MSFIFYYKNTNNLSYVNKFNDFFYSFNDTNPKPSENIILKNHNCVCILYGLIFTQDFENILLDNWQQKPELLHKIEGEFSIIKYIFNENKVYIYSSKTGIENLYLYNKGNMFAVSNDFWMIADYIRPSKNSIDVEALVESLYYIYPFNYRTIISGLIWFPPATIGIYNIDTFAFKMMKHWNYKFTYELEVNFDEVADEIENILDETFIKIKKKCGDVKYGVGLSGGLDSRIIPFFAIKNGMKITPFIISRKRPHFLLSRDNKSSRKLAKLYNIELKEIGPLSDGIIAQINNDIMTYPLGPSALGKLNINELPEFDILLTGASGLLVGSELPEAIDSYTPKQLSEVIAKHCGRLTRINMNRDRIQRALDYLFNIKIKFKSKEIHLTSKKNEERMMGNWLDFVLERKKIGLDNFAIYEEYFSHIIGSRNRLGAFESLSGNKISYSIYVPFFFEKVLKWPKEYFFNRKALKYYLSKKMKNVSSFSSQSYMANDNNKTVSRFQKIKSMVDYILRGTGTENYGGYFRRRKLFKTIKKGLLSSDSWFYNYISYDQVIKFVKTRNIDVCYHILKKKLVLDKLQKKYNKED